MRLFLSMFIAYIAELFRDRSCSCPGTYCIVQILHHTKSVGNNDQSSASCSQRQIHPHNCRMQGGCCGQRGHTNVFVQK